LQEEKPEPFQAVKPLVNHLIEDEEPAAKRPNLCEFYAVKISKEPQTLKLMVI